MCGFGSHATHDGVEWDTESSGLSSVLDSERSMSAKSWLRGTLPDSWRLCSQASVQHASPRTCIASALSQLNNVQSPEVNDGGDFAAALLHHQRLLLLRGGRRHSRLRSGRHSSAQRSPLPSTQMTGSFTGKGPDWFGSCSLRSCWKRKNETTEAGKGRRRKGGGGARSGKS